MTSPNSPKSTLFALVAILLLPIGVSADPIVIVDSCADDSAATCVTGIQNLAVGQVNYDVTFEIGRFGDVFNVISSFPSLVYESTFFGDSDGALLATQSILAALSGQRNVPFVESTYGAIYLPFYAQPVYTGGFFPRLDAGGYLIFSRGSYRQGSTDRSAPTRGWAVFSPAAIAVSEPGTLALLSLGLVGLAVARRRI